MYFTDGVIPLFTVSQVISETRQSRDVKLCFLLLHFQGMKGSRNRSRSIPMARVCVCNGYSEAVSVGLEQ